MKTKTKSNLNPVLITLLSTLSQPELRSLASASQVPKGKSKTATMENLIAAVEKGTLQFKMVGTLQIPPSGTSSFKRPVLVKKLRTYKEPKTYVLAQPAGTSSS